MRKGSGGEHQLRRLENAKEIDDVRRYLVNYYAEDIAADFNPAFLLLFKEMAKRFLFQNFYQSIRVSTQSEDTFDRLRELNGNAPVVYLPNHVSNVDHLPVCLSINGEGLWHPLIAAGANLFRGISEDLLYSLNAYKLQRRNIAPEIKGFSVTWFQNPVYTRVHEEYIHQLFKD